LAGRQGCEKLGEDHGAMHHDLVGMFACSACREAGRDERPVFFTVLPDYAADRARARSAGRKIGQGMTRVSAGRSLS
jgi:hypothetical protein